MKWTLLAVGVAAGDLSAHWEEFKQKYGKTYSPSEELEKFKTFADNAQIVESMRKLDGSAQYSLVTPNADMSEAEFTARNNLRVTPEALEEHRLRAQKNAGKLNAVNLPTSFDWREKGAVTPVKDQGQCGSCWAFGTVGSMEGSNFVVNGDLRSFSEQEIVDCDPTDNACNGGLPQNAYQWIINSGHGLEAENSYRYDSGRSGVRESCKADASKDTVRLRNWHHVPSSETEMMSHLLKYGSLAVAVNASGFQFYNGGIFNPSFCPHQLNHAVTLVGWGEENGQKFWIIKNSWNTIWGEAGYIRMARGVNMCGIQNLATAAEVAGRTEAVFV